MTEWIISSSVLISVMLLLRGLLRGKVNPRVQYALWGIVLLRLLMPFSLFQSGLSVQNLHEEVLERPEVQQVYQAMNTPIVPVTGGQTTDLPPVINQSTQPQQDQTPTPLPQQQPDSSPTQTTPTVPEHLVSLSDVLTHIWIAGMVLMALWLAGCNLRFSARLKRSRKPLDIPDSLISVYQTGAVETPCLFGLFAPAVYLTLSVAEDGLVRRYVLTHELTHYRQFDHVWSVLRAAALVLHWYNPLVWIAFRASRQDGEMACDEGTLMELGEEHRGNYGRTLISLATRTRFRGTMVTATSMGGTKRAMKERIVILMKNPKTALMTMISLILVCTLIVGCTFTGAVDKPTEPEETTTVETTSPVETTAPMETTTPTESVTLDYTPLTDEQLQQANEAFKTNHDTSNEVFTANPLNNFNSCYYSDPSEINLYKFIRYFSYQGDIENMDSHFNLLTEKYPELEEQRRHYNITRYPADTVDEIMFKYTGYHIDDLYGTRDVDGVYYLEKTDSYYSFASDAGSFGLTFHSGRIFEGYVELYDTEKNVLTLVERDGKYYIHSYLPHLWDAPVALTDEEVQEINERLNSSLAVPKAVNCFFTSYYEDPSQIDLEEFLRHFTAKPNYANEIPDVTEEEFDDIRVLDGFLFDEMTDLEQLPVPIHKYPAHLVDAILRDYTGIGLDALANAKGGGGVFYSEKYDAYYNFTSDYGPGFFKCIGGYNQGSVVTLYSEDSVLTLHWDESRYLIYSHLPRN